MGQGWMSLEPSFATTIPGPPGFEPSYLMEVPSAVLCEHRTLCARAAVCRGAARTKPGLV